MKIMKSLLRHIAVLAVFWVMAIVVGPAVKKLLEIFLRPRFLRDLAEGFLIICTIGLCCVVSAKIDPDKPPQTIPLIICVFLTAAWYLILAIAYFFVEKEIYNGIVCSLLCIECIFQGIGCIAYRCG